MPDPTIPCACGNLMSRTAKRCWTCHIERRRADAMREPASCSEPGCIEPARTKRSGLCNTHYLRRRREQRSDGWRRCECGELFPPKHGRRRCKRCAREAIKKGMRASALLREYGLTLERYEAMCDAQRDPSGVIRCAICGTDDLGRGHAHFSVDHNHKTGEVRGLLCHSCNVAIGLLDHSIANLLKGAVYLGLKLPDLPFAWHEPESGVVMPFTSAMFQPEGVTMSETEHEEVPEVPEEPEPDEGGEAG